MNREKRKFTGQMIEGDFEENTMKFRIDGEMILQAGNYTIMLTDDFNKLSEPATNSNTSKAKLSIKRVIGSIIGYPMVIPMALIYFMLLIIINPIQYLIVGKSYIAQKFHKYIAKLIDKYCL